MPRALSVYSPLLAPRTPATLASHQWPFEFSDPLLSLVSGCVHAASYTRSPHNRRASAQAPFQLLSSASAHVTPCHSRRVRQRRPYCARASSLLWYCSVKASAMVRRKRRPCRSSMAPTCTSSSVYHATPPHTHHPPRSRPPRPRPPHGRPHRAGLAPAAAAHHAALPQLGGRPLPGCLNAPVFPASGPSCCAAGPALQQTLVLL